MINIVLATANISTLFNIKITRSFKPECASIKQNNAGPQQKWNYLITLITFWCIDSKNSCGDQHYLPRDSSRFSACVYLEVALYVRPFVHPSIRAYSPACLCRCPGPVHRWDRTECRGGRSSKRPTQFQAGSQLLLVLRRSAENERRTSGVCVVWRRSARLYPWSGPLVIRVVPAAESREVRMSSVLSATGCRDERVRVRRIA